jgi:membrane peptidoglycan carboxypeptidase
LIDFTKKNEEGIYQMQGAAVCIDNDNGRVVAIVGGRSQDLKGYTFNRGYQSYRQPGSAIKPLIVYAPSFERGYTPESIVVDERFEGGPKNSGGSYQGSMKLQRAIELSKNTIAWKLFDEITPATGLSYLLHMNFAKISQQDYVPAAALGGLTVGVSPVEMAAAYSTLENDGYYREPSCIVKIMDSEGNEIVGDAIKRTLIYDTNAARIMTEALTGVIKKGTGVGLGLTNTISAGKTGTTNDKKDGWFVGYTPYYTTSVWVGYDLPKSVNDLTGASYPGSIWHEFMEQLHDSGMNKTFDLYDWRAVLKKEQEEKERIEKEKALEEGTELQEDDFELEGEAPDTDGESEAVDDSTEDTEELIGDGETEEYTEDEYIEDEYTGDEATEDEISEGEVSEDEATEDEYIEDEYTEDEFTEDDATEEETAEDEISEDESAEDESDGEE